MLHGSDNCNTSIVGLFRECPEASCSYDLCLTCCRELREGHQPGGNEAETSHQQYVERADDQVNHHEDNENAQEQAHSLQSQNVLAAADMSADTYHHFPNWRVSSDGRIPCPPKERGGCGSAILELRRIFKADWVKKLLESAEELTTHCESFNVDQSPECSWCQPNDHEKNYYKQSELRKAAFRKNSHNNFLYCPSALHLEDDEIEHFQRHWMRGEPVIVRDVLEKTSGLSWEPMVMWRAFRETGSNVKFKEETKSVKAIDCLDWCEVNYLNF